MDSFVPLTFDISEIYRQYCEILSGRDVIGDEGHMFDDKSHKSRSLNELLKLVNEKSISILEEIHKMMLRLNLMVDFSEFSRFYDFVFFMCRESGQKNITINKAVMAWRLVLSGRFRLLDEWCDFVEKNHRHNISEDTWRQVLAFSRCVHENLEGYDPEGAWPVLIDDFVEHMYRIRGSNNICCDCGDSEGLSFDESLPGLKMFSGLKRKFSGALLKEDSDYNKVMNFKKRQINSSAKIVNNQKNSNGSLKSSCSVEGCLSKGFAGVRV